MMGGVNGLQDELRELYQKLREGTRAHWHRDLPFDEMIFDRWERARSLGFEESSSIYHHSYVYGDVTVGKGTWIGPFTILDGSGGLVIGQYCSISSGVHIYTHDTVRWALSGGKSDPDRLPVSIGDCCYIGSQTVIGKGVRIANHCVIGACSFVNRDIPAFSVAFGAPCRTVGRVEIDDNGKISLVFDTNTRENHA